CRPERRRHAATRSVGQVRPPRALPARPQAHANELSVTTYLRGFSRQTPCSVPAWLRLARDRRDDTRAAHPAMVLRRQLDRRRRAVAGGCAPALADDRRRVRVRPRPAARRRPAARCLLDHRPGLTFWGDMRAGAVVVGASGAAVCHTLISCSPGTTRASRLH